MKIRINNKLSVLVFLVTIISVNPWIRFPIGNTISTWCIDFLTIFTIFWYKKVYFHPINKKYYNVVYIYLVWLFFCVIRGVFIADNYWEWKNLVAATVALLLPVFVYVFSIPSVLRDVLKLWIKYALPIFFIFFIWVLPRGGYYFYLGPVFLLACFMPIIKRKYKWLFVGLLLFMVFAEIGARSQSIKALVALSMSVAYIFSKYISTRILKMVHWLFYFLPLFLLFLGISGIFNIFQDMDSHKGKYVEQKVVDGNVVQLDLYDDTRSEIYLEVITSAVLNNYVLWGRTPARGNDSESFSEAVENIDGITITERFHNEVCFLNIFTWLGLIGVILYGLIYLRSSYLAVYKSNNIFVKLVGVFVAFRFMYGWVEDINAFDIMNISLWMMISMGFSEDFRKMNNMEFKSWVRSIF